MVSPLEPGELDTLQVSKFAGHSLYQLPYCPSEYVGAKILLSMFLSNTAKSVTSDLTSGRVSEAHIVKVRRSHIPSFVRCDKFFEGNCFLRL